MKEKRRGYSEYMQRNRWKIALALSMLLFFSLITVLTVRDRIQDFVAEQVPQYTQLTFLLYRLFDLFGFSGLLGLALQWIFLQKALNVIRKLIDATRKVAAGDFTAHVEPEKNSISELNELSLSFNKMTQELASTEAMRSDFINTFSHELKTPLMSLKGFARLLKEGNLNPEEEREFLEIICSESERLAAIATKTLQLSKYEHIEIVADKAPFRLDEQIRRTVVLAEAQWAAKNLQLSVELEEIVLNGNEELLAQLWINLLDNAIKFTPEGGVIRILLRRVGGEVRFIIRDSGIGMDEQVRAHCFDRFYQANQDLSKTGNGLGLAIAKRITQLSGAAITAESEPGKGSMFTVVF